MILCCKACGSCFESNVPDQVCDYCCGNTEVLFSDEEVNAIDKYELDNMIAFAREKYKVGNADYNEELWKSREYKEQISEHKNIKYKINAHMLTTGYNFEKYEIVAYRGIVSGEVVLGTSFLSEITASFSDFFGTEVNNFSNKLESAKDAALQRLTEKSISVGGNALIGIDFDYIVFGNNMIGVVANGTSVIVEEIR